MTEYETAVASGKTVYPDGLQERDWWVNWVLAYRYDELTETGDAQDDAKPAKQPVAPYDTGDAEPARWHGGLSEQDHPRTDYETVAKWDSTKIGVEVEAPPRVASDELGVGIIQKAAAEIDAEPITLLDWDDVRRPETGEIHPVCARALDELDGFAEISQSGEGIHQFVYGEVPGPNRQFLRHIDDTPFVGDDRPMIEMYSGTRLTALTGQHIKGCGEELVDGQEVINGLCLEFGDGTNNSTKNPTDPFAAQRDGGDDAEIADSETTQKEVEQTMADLASYDGPHPESWELPADAGPLEVMYHAVLRAWELDEKPPGVAHWQLMGYAATLGHEMGKRKESVVADLSEYEPRRRAKKEVASVWRKAEAGNATRPSVETLQQKGLLPEGYSPFDTRPTPTNPVGDLVANDGKYGYITETTDESGEVYREFKQATNFLLETLAVIEVDDEQRLRLRVRPATDEQPYEVEVHPTVFNESRTFQEEVVRGRTTHFENVFGNALGDLRLTVGRQHAPRHTGTAHVGAARPRHHDDELPDDAWTEWVTPDGVLTADGWIGESEGEHTYVARSQSQTGDESIVGEKWDLTPSDDTVDDEQVREVLKRLPRARLPDRALATLSWFYAAPLKPLIYHAEEEFPHLSVRGKTASGKTAWLSKLSEALGMDGTPFAADATTFSLEMMHVGSRGAPVWIDEYKPSQMSPGRQDKLHTYLREATREAVHTKGRPDQSFISYRMQSPVCVSGEQTIKEPAVARRSMQVQLSSRATDMTEHTRAYAELAGEAYEAADGKTEIADGYDLDNHALAYHQWLLDHDAEELLETWTDCRDETARLLDVVGADVSDTERQAVQVIVFGCRLFRRFAASYGVAESDLPTTQTLESAVEHVTDNVGKNGQRREHGDELLELLSQTAAAGYLDPESDDGDTPYRVYQPQTAEDDAIAVHLPSVYPEVQRFVRDYNLEGEYNLLSKRDYVDEFTDVAGDDSHILAASKVVRNVIHTSRKRCLEIDATRARRRLGEDFIASAFGAEVSVDEAPGHPEDDDTPPSPASGGVERPDEITPANIRDHILRPEADVESLGDPITGKLPTLRFVLKPCRSRYGTPYGDIHTPGKESEEVKCLLEGADSRPETGIELGTEYEVVGAELESVDGLQTVVIGPAAELRRADSDSEHTQRSEMERVTVGASDTATQDPTSRETEAAATDGGKTDDGDAEPDNAEPDGDTDDAEPADGDPERPTGPYDDGQCRECGTYWNHDPDDPKEKCPDCSEPVDWSWNVATGRVPAAKAPSGRSDTDHETVRGQIVEWLRDEPEPVTITRATVDLDVDADAAREVFGRLVEDGRLIDTETDGHYEVNR